TGAPAGTATPVTGNGCPLNLEIPANGYIALLPGQGSYLQIQKVGQALNSGANVGLTFQFADSQGKQWATDSFQVPMGVPLTALPRASSDIEEAEH
ncbi:MAG: hypothetical protein H0T78_00035, partial [Longispora sp.]|nr:hypothetical protein [Longispora sp. (in: high G+C Gram-positive bacteria)]